jgi:hypothetical protein
MMKLAGVFEMRVERGVVVVDISDTLSRVYQVSLVYFHQHEEWKSSIPALGPTQSPIQ